METPFNLKDALSEAEKDMNMSSDKWFKFKEGVNRVRLLSVTIPFSSHFKIGACLGKELCPTCIENAKETDEKNRRMPSTKFLARIFDYSDNEIKLAQLPYGVVKSLQTLQDDPDYEFNSAPMPYDIKINAEGAGTKEVTYNVTPTPKREPVSKDVLDKLATMHTPEQIKEAMKRKRMKELGLYKEDANKATPGADRLNGVDYPSEQINPDDIPF